MLGGGWHGSPLTWSGNRFFTGPELLRAQLDITFEDGHHETIGTDNTWQTAAAPVLSSEIYGGEAYDARAEIPGWSEPGFAAAGWSPAVTGTAPDGVEVTASPDAPITTIITLHPESLDPANGAHPADLRHGAEHGGQRPAACARAARHGGAAALCRTPESRWQHLYRKSAQRDRHRLLHALRRGR